MEVTRICISAPTLALLLYDLENSTTDVEGIFVGSVGSIERTALTDTSDNNVTRECVMNISDCLKLGKPFTLYDSELLFARKEVLELLGEVKKKVVGWFRFRRDATSGVSLLESRVTERVAQSLDRVNGNEEGTTPFIFGLLTVSRGLEGSILSYDYGFYCRGDYEKFASFVFYMFFQCVNVQILNFSESAQNTSESKTQLITGENSGVPLFDVPSSHPLSKEKVNELLQKISVDNVKVIEEHYRDILRIMENTALEVDKNEDELRSQRDKVDALRIKLEKKVRENTAT